jgi:hypothetical protein
LTSEGFENLYDLGKSKDAELSFTEWDHDVCPIAFGLHDTRAHCRDRRVRLYDDKSFVEDFVGDSQEESSLNR